MKLNTALKVLIPITGILALFAAAVGVFSTGGPGAYTFTTLHGAAVEMYGRGIYRFDSMIFGAGFLGADVVTILAFLPFLAFSYIATLRGSKNGAILLIGALFFFLYNGASMTFSAAFNSLFLVYAAIFSTALFAVIGLMAAVDVTALARRVGPGFPHGRMAVFLIVIGLATLLLWISELIGPMLSGEAPANLGPYTTMYTHGFDSAVISPAAVLAGVFLLQRRRWGYLLAAPVMILCVMIGIVVIGQTISQTLAGLVFPIGVYIGMVGSWLVMGAFATLLTISYFRNLSND